MFRGALWLLGSAVAFSCGGEPAHTALPTPVASTAVAAPSAERTTPVRVAPSVTRRVIVSFSRVSGSDVASTAPDGTVTVALDVQENGRGPHTDATARFAADGTLSELSASGHHEMGTPVEEVFRQAGSRASWHGREETGERELQHSAFFVPLAELPDALGWLVQALLKAGGTLPLLPAGQARLEKTGDTAVRAGYDGIEHINMLFLNFFADHQTDTRTTLRFSLVGDRAASLDLESAPVRDFIRLLQQHHTIIDPTLGIFEELLCGQQGKLMPDEASFAGRLPVQAERWFPRGGLPMDGDKSKVYGASFEKMLALVKALHDAKVPVVAGTDDFAGWFVHLELELFVRAGLSPAEALRAATIEPARLMKQDKRSGSIAAGKAADLFIVAGDPLTKIMDVDNVVQTVRGGLLYASTPLYESVGVRPYEQP